MIGALAAIVSLFKRRRPAAIVGGVGAVIINAVERVFFAGSLAHVGKEIVEDHPAFANGDATRAVPFPLRRFGVVPAYRACRMCCTFDVR